MIHLVGAVDDAAAASVVRHDLVTLMVDGTVYVGQSVWTHPCPDMDSLRQHDAAVSDLMAVCTVVPFRFGTVVRDAADLEDKGRGLGHQMSNLLRRLHGRREVALRVVSEPDPFKCGKASSSGAGYLRTLGPPSEVAQFHERLAAQAVDAVSTWDPHQALFKASYLVDAGAVATFTQAARLEAGARPGLEAVSLTGPWAPYSFASLHDAREVARV